MLYIQETLNPHVWGGQQQIVVAAYVWDASIHVHTPFGVEVYGQGPEWHLVYATDPVGHYDVFLPEAPEIYRGPAAPTHKPPPLAAIPIPPVPDHKPKNLPPGSFGAHLARNQC